MTPASRHTSHKDIQLEAVVLESGCDTHLVQTFSLIKIMTDHAPKIDAAFSAVLP